MMKNIFEDYDHPQLKIAERQSEDETTSSTRRRNNTTMERSNSSGSSSKKSSTKQSPASTPTKPKRSRNTNSEKQFPGM